MKYPFQPELLDALPEELAELYRSLEDTLLDEICSRLKATDQLNEVTVQDIRALRSHGIDLKEIKEAIRKTTGISEQKLNALLDDVVERNQQYYTEVIDLAHITQPETLVSIEDTWAIYEQTKQTLRNITRSMGFLVDNGRTMLEPANAYQWALDNAATQVQSGAVSYNQAIKSAVRQLAESGIKIVDYESGHCDQIDVAARRAVMTGVNQICAKYTEQSAEYLETQYFEVSAHAGARDKPGPSPWSSHKEWQGKVYSTRSGDIYPSIYDVCGLGYVDGLEGANCRHRRFPWVEGVSERTYTDEQLAHIDDGLGCTFDGKQYTAYEATQMQRRVERQIRAQKRLVNAYKATGLTDDATAANVKLFRLNAKYKAFSKAAGLPEQKERLKVLYQDKTRPLVNAGKSAIIKEKADKGGSGVQTIGKIDVEKYRVVSKGIRTDEVVITDERIQHIKDRHPNDFERYSGYITEIVKNPDYILEANKPNTAFLLKEFTDADERLQLILRLAVEGDNPGYKNSVITFLKVEEKRYKRYLRTKKILYKSE
jgi:DNA-binding transcriptional MerR regulator